MHTEAPSLLDSVYAKTAQGHQEIVRPKFGLNSRQRRILVFIDGMQALSGLHREFPVQEISDIVSVLSEQHFIRLVCVHRMDPVHSLRHENLDYVYRWNSARPGDRSVRRADARAALTGDHKNVMKAKNFMLELAAIHLGILGRDLAQKIEAADCAQALASLAGQWAMALCASKTAPRYAPLYLEQLKGMLFEAQDDSDAAYS